MNPSQLLEYFNCITEAPNAIPRLSRFILDLAVRGKLVEQDPKDEPASELLKRIKQEKERLVKEGKIKKQNTLPPVSKDEIPFNIPNGWEWVRLGETINSHLGGGTPSKNNLDYWNGQIFWASVKDIGKGKYIDETIDQITESGLENSSSNLIPSGSLIIVTRMGLGKLSINRVPIAINQDLRALLLSSLTVIDYYYIFFKTYSFNGTGLTVKGIKTEELLSICFPLPPLKEQQRIVTKVDELMTLCDQLEAAQKERENQRDRLVKSVLFRLTNTEIKLTDSKFFLQHLPRITTRPEHIKPLRQTILNLAVRGKLVEQDPKDEPAEELLKRIKEEKEKLVKEGKIKKQNTLPPVSKDEIPFNIPNGWEWVRLGEIIISRDGERIPISKEERNKRAKIYDYYGASGIIDKIDGYLFDKSLLLIGEDGANLINRSTPIAFIARGKYWVNNHAHVLDGISEDFLCYIELHINAIDLKPFVTGTAQPKMNQAKMNSIPITVPPLKEQQRIVSKVDELMTLCDQLEEQLKTSQIDSSRLLEALLAP